MERLPWIVQKKILGMMSLSDLSSLAKVSTHFLYLVSSEYMHWIREVSLVNIMPHSGSITGLQWLATVGNLEATLKLAILLPYQDGRVRTAEGRKECATLAAELFCSLESSAKLKCPLTWMFIRPPWSSSTVCRKLMVYEHILKLLEQETNSANMCYCIARVHMLFPNDERLEQAKCWMEKARSQGSIDAQFQLWQWEFSDTTGSNAKCLEPGTRLNLIRRLRSIAYMKYEPAEIQLCQLYARGYHDGVTTAKAYSTVKNFFTRSQPYCDKVFSAVQSEVTGPMRCILVDWLMEVTITKYFSTATFHAAVQCLDRYLALRLVSRKNFQLIGIACLVICSRSMETDILTIREAVWFTDSSFTYKELVQIVGDIVSALKGNIKLPTITDYLDILLMVPDMNDKAKFLARFVADSCILYSEVGMLPPALVACCCVLLANLTVNSDSVAWNSEMEEMTGFSIQNLETITRRLHDQCISLLTSEQPTKASLTALDEKYEDCLYGPITRDQIVSYDRVVQFFNKSEYSKTDHDTAAAPSFSGVSNHVRNDSKCHMLNQAPSKESQLADMDMDADTPPNVFCAYALQSDAKSRKRIHPNEDRTSNAMVLSSCNCEVAHAIRNSDSEKVSVKQGCGGPPTSACSEGRSTVRSDENSDRKAIQNNYYYDDNKDEVAQSSRDSNLLASKSIKFMR